MYSYLFFVIDSRKKYKSNLIVGLCIIIMNFIYEAFLPVLNTVDIINAIYGMIGVSFYLIYLYIISKYGFEEKV